MKKYYLRFNSLTHNVDVFKRSDNSLIGSVKVINNGASLSDVYQIANALDISEEEQIKELDYDIFCEDRDGRELAEESPQEV